MHLLPLVSASKTNIPVGKLHAVEDKCVLIFPLDFFLSPWGDLYDSHYNIIIQIIKVMLSDSHTQGWRITDTATCIKTASVIDLYHMGFNVKIKW